MLREMAYFTGKVRCHCRVVYTSVHRVAKGLAKGPVRCAASCPWGRSLGPVLRGQRGHARHPSFGSPMATGPSGLALAGRFFAGRGRRHRARSRCADRRGRLLRLGSRSMERRYLTVEDLRRSMGSPIVWRHIHGKASSGGKRS